MVIIVIILSKELGFVKRSISTPPSLLLPGKLQSYLELRIVSWP